MGVRGKGFEAEYPEFSEYLKKAEHGDADAQYKVGHLYYYGFDNIERDYREGKRWLKRAAGGGNARAMFELGKMALRSNDPLERQNGIEQLQLAFRGLTSEAEYETDTFAKRALGEIYEKGLLFEPDPDAAAYWNERAAEQEGAVHSPSFYDLFADEDEELEQWYIKTEQERQRRYQEKMQAIKPYPDNGRVNEQEVNEKVEKGILQFLNPKSYETYLNVVSNFHSYSFNNTLLVALQNPSASLGAGKYKWKKEFERTVREEEAGNGIMIYAPLTDKDGHIVPGKQEFKEVYIYDVSQTEGKEIPKLTWQFSAGNMQENADFLACLKKISPVQVGEDTGSQQALKSAIEDTGKDKLQKLKEKGWANPDAHTQSIQEKSISYIVCRHFGLDTSGYSFDDIAGWVNGKNMDDIKSALETVRTVSHDFIDALEKDYTNLQAQRIQEEYGINTGKAEETYYSGCQLTITPEIDRQNNAPRWSVKLKERISRYEFAKLSENITGLGGYYSKENQAFIFEKGNPVPLFQSQDTPPAIQQKGISTNNPDTKSKAIKPEKEYQEGEVYYKGFHLVITPARDIRDDSTMWIVTPHEKLNPQKFTELNEQVQNLGSNFFKFSGGFIFSSANPITLLQSQGARVLLEAEREKESKKEPAKPERKPLRGTPIPFCIGKSR